MELINYNVYQNCADLFFDNGRSLRVYFNEWTGNVYKRPKLDAVLRYFIDHKGIYIGESQFGEHIVIHSHITPGKPTLVTWKNFIADQVVTLDNKACTNTIYETVEIALQKVMIGEPYDLFNNSCQTLTNEACTNVRKNDDTGRAIAGVLMGVGLILLVGAAISS